MDNAFISDEKKLKRIPRIFKLILILLLGFPAIALNYFGFDFSGIMPTTEGEHSLSVFIIGTQIQSYFIHLILQWSAFSLSAITVILAFIQYRLSNDKIALIIGLSILFSGSVEALDTLLIDGPPYIPNKENIDAFIWTFTNAVSGFILIFGFILILKNHHQAVFRLHTFALLNIALVLLAIAGIYYTKFIIHHPIMCFKDAFIFRPYELIYLSIYFGIILFLHPKLYKKFPTILTNSIFYMSLTQVVIALYLMFLSNTPYDGAYNIAYFLKIIVYLIPFFCLITNYVYSYNSILAAQQTLQMDQEKLKYVAAHDPLTDLYNRRAFEDLLEITVANSARSSDLFALFLIDIDNFKAINDTMGHLHGDNFLKQFSETLSALTRKGDILARIGGDEFTVITPKLKSPTAFRTLAERLVNGLNIPYSVDDKLLIGSVSLGIAIYPMDGNNSEELLKNADIAMYAAKNSGKNTFRCFTKKLNSEQNREAKIESLLQKALEEDNFTLCYQPQYNLITRKIVGAEILLRLNNGLLGQILPDEFIPVAEKSHLMIQIGNWVLHHACDQIKQWSEKYKQHLLFSINVSPIQFENNDFFTQFKNTLEFFNYPANYLSIEITENLIMKNNDIVSTGLENIGALGSSISLDDFGMGYSSLSRLQALPINTLKIDKLFVANIHNNLEKVIIIDTIIKLAHELGMNVIAEGIETESQLNYLVSKNCTLGQGFLLNKPLPADVFEALAY